METRSAWTLLQAYSLEFIARDMWLSLLRQVCSMKASYGPGVDHYSQPGHTLHIRKEPGHRWYAVLMIYPSYFQASEYVVHSWWYCWSRYRRCGLSREICLVSFDVSKLSTFSSMFFLFLVCSFKCELSAVLDTHGGGYCHAFILWQKWILTIWIHNSKMDHLFSNIL